VTHCHETYKDHNVSQPYDPSPTEPTPEQQKKFERKLWRDFIVGFLVILACIGLLGMLPDSMHNPITVLAVGLLGVAILGFVLFYTGD
jgi:hypothetical protein